MIIYLTKRSFTQQNVYCKHLYYERFGDNSTKGLLALQSQVLVAVK